MVRQDLKYIFIFKISCRKYCAIISRPQNFRNDHSTSDTSSMSILAHKECVMYIIIKDFMSWNKRFFRRPANNLEDNVISQLQEPHSVLFYLRNKIRQ